MVKFLEKKHEIEIEEELKICFRDATGGRVAGSGA